MLWWFIHMMRIVTKLVTNAKNEAHWSRRPCANEPVPFRIGSLKFRTSSVIAIVKMPSLNASVRIVSFSSRRSSRMVRAFGKGGSARSTMRRPASPSVAAAPTAGIPRRPSAFPPADPRGRRRAVVEIREGDSGDRTAEDSLNRADVGFLLRRDEGDRLADCLHAGRAADPVDVVRRDRRDVVVDHM